MFIVIDDRTYNGKSILWVNERHRSVLAPSCPLELEKVSWSFCVAGIKEILCIYAIKRECRSSALFFIAMCVCVDGDC